MTFGAFHGQLRPLVDAAWKNHAGLMGVSVSDREQKDAFYRDHLWACCRLKSTKQASQRQYYDLLDWFAKETGATLSMREAAPPSQDPPHPRILQWSRAQSDVFWKLAQRARHAAAQRAGEAEAGTLEAWAQTRLESALGRPVLVCGDWLLGSETAGFDEVMAVLAVDAADMYWIEQTEASGERRLLWQLDRFLADLSWLEGKEVCWKYVRGIYAQSNSKKTLPERLEDCPSPKLFLVLAMLDTQIRHLCDGFNIRPCWCPTRPPADPLELLTWRFYHSPSPGHVRGPDGRLLQPQHEQKGAA